MNPPEPLKNLTKVGIEAVSNLTQGFSEGGVMGMIDAARSDGECIC